MEEHSLFEFKMKDIMEIISAVIVAWLFYQGLAFVTGTPMPIVSVVSQSMEPVLHRGDLLFVVGPKNLGVGDIIIYDRPEVSYTIVHRINASTENGYIIKGDNNPVPDAGYVQEYQIKGRVVFAMPLLGYPRLALNVIGI